jgi:ADP-ribosylglycohydrolase
VLIEIAVGDAYGAGFEYVSVDERRGPNDLSRFVKHPRHGIIPGYYTDDTQMSIAIAEALVSGEPWKPLMIAEHFVRAFKRDPIEGYSGHFHTFLQEIESGEEFLRRIRPESDKSGASMRACPLGVLPDVPTVLDYCETQAALTHNTPDGIHAAQAASLITHYFVYDLGPRSRLGEFLDRSVQGGPWSGEWSGKVGSKGWMSVRAAVTALRRNDRLSDLLIDCIEFGGDVDTVASIALGAASCSREYEQDLPESLIGQLQNGPYGRDFLRNLDQKLMALVQH